MKVTYNWLKDFVDIKVPAQKLADKLTMAGLEVTGLEERGGDFIFELEITPNRPDCLSVIGIAREVAAITGRKLKLDTRYSIFDTRKNKRASSIQQPAAKLEIKIENKKDCPVYIGRIIKGIQVKAAPDWLKSRLELVGLRSVNNVVDITNYVLWETGQPLHAFDLDRLGTVNQINPALSKSGASESRKGGINITVRRAKRDEEIVTIDGLNRKLSQDILLIAAGRYSGKPVAIAGIMGGRDSEVSNKTQNIFLESAVFNPVITRRASRKLGLSSESSYRFERGVDCQGADSNSLRAVNLFLELAEGKLALTKAVSKPKEKKKIVILKPKEAKRILGRDYSSGEIGRIFTCLGFSSGSAGSKGIKAGIPSFRSDINQPVDLIEEIARISGYKNIPSRLPRIIPQDVAMSRQRLRNKEIKEILFSQGISEVITYSLISKDLAGQCAYSESQLMAIANPLTTQQEILRPGLIPGLATCIGYNLNQKQRDIRIFESGNIFLDNQERPCLGLACLGKELNLLHIKGILELLARRMGIADFEFSPLDGRHPCLQKETALTLRINNKSCAELGMIKPDILASLDIEGLVFVAELDLGIFFAETDKGQKKYIPLALYPEVMRDISIVLKQDIAIGDVIKKVKANKIPYLIRLDLKDYYLGKQIPAGHKGLTLSCIYQASDHTLTSQEIDSSQQRVREILQREFFAQQR
jgi:phenylalanyl-tRNA synthetase beta chain